MFGRVISRLSAFCSTNSNRWRQPSKTFASKASYDIAIVGGGMTGCAMACSLGSSELLKTQSVLLIDAAPKQAILEDHRSVQFSNRVCAISPRSVQLFQKLGIWQSVLSRSACPVLQMVVWEDCSQASVVFEDSEPSFDVPGYDCNPIAYIIENHIMVDSFQQRLRQMENVSVVHGSAVQSCSFREDSAEPTSLTLSNGDVINARLVIGADGFESSIRKAMGVHVLRFSYNQASIVANLKLLPAGINNTAWQRFTRSGPLALLPLSDDTSSLSWALQSDAAKKMMDLSNEDFLDALNVALNQQNDQNNIVNSAVKFSNSLFSCLSTNKSHGKKYVHPTVVGVENRACLSLQLIHATHYFNNRTVLIGDAAHRIHPLAGQGVNLGYADVQTLTEVLEEALKCGDDIASAMFLKQYETMRQREVVSIALACDGLYRLYATELFPVVLARSFGLNVVEKMPWLKQCLLNVAAKSPRSSSYFFN